MNINISNLPPMPFEADWEYTISPMGENWKKSVESGDVYHLSDGWHRSGSRFGWLVYARPKPAPEPEEHYCGGPCEACMTPGCQECGMQPKPAPERYIDIPIVWNMYPMAFTVGIDGIQYRHVADTGLLHWQNGREYRLSRFLFPDGASLRFPVDENLGGGIKATHARFYPVVK